MRIGPVWEQNKASLIMGDCDYISHDEVYVGTTLVLQALSAGRASPM